MTITERLPSVAVQVISRGRGGPIGHSMYADHMVDQA